VATKPRKAAPQPTTEARTAPVVGSLFFEDRIIIRRTLKDGSYVCRCKCGKLHKLRLKELYGEFPCACGTSPYPGKAKKSKKPTSDVSDRLAEVDSVFKREVENIHHLLESKNTDTAVTRFQKSALATLIELIPIAESKYRKYGNERAAYAMNSLISQSRELITDIKAEQNSRDLALRITSEILRPAFVMIMQNMVDNMYHLKKNMEGYVPDKHTRDIHTLTDTSAREITHYLEQTYKSVSDRIMQELG
jgi:hypothetical protein